MPARLAYVRFCMAEEARARAWKRAASEITRALPDVPWNAGEPAAADEASRSPGGVVGWRLLSDNRRDVARSGILFRDEDTARAHVAALARRWSVVQTHVFSFSVRGGAGWCARVGGDLEMMCARRYERRSAAESAAEVAHRLLQTLDDAITSAG